MVFCECAGVQRVVRPGAPIEASLLLVAVPGAPSSVLAPKTWFGETPEFVSNVRKGWPPLHAASLFHASEEASSKGPPASFPRSPSG